MKKNKIIKRLSKFLDKYQINETIKKITGLSDNQLFFCENLEIEENLLQELEEKLEEKVPFEYIINNAEFYSYDFYVDSRVLIPRNDSEIMVNETIKEIEKNKKVEYIDIWTGSWCIGISVIKNSKNIEKSYMIDISNNALEVVKINLKKHNLKNIEILNKDLLFWFKSNFAKKIITANLPYIKNDDFENMSPETIIYEPKLALYWWENTGFELYEKLINQCIKIKNIVLFIEIWFDQKEYCESYLNSKWLKFEFFKDNNKIDRCVKIYI